MVDARLILPAPRQQDRRDGEMWVDEQIWGHRLFHSQSPWLLFLEFLVVAESRRRAGELFDGETEELQFRPHKRLHLRNILFNSEPLFQIDERYPESATAWAKWLEWMSEHARGVNSRDFSYLKDRFRSFRQFAALVRMLRGSAVESESNRRWHSRFVFPFGPNALYEDLNVTATDNVSREYINFGRTGELMYLMITRSSFAAELRQKFDALLSGDNPWNKLLALFQHDVDEDLQTRRNSYLPYRRHPAFDNLGEDWLRVLSLGLPGFDAYPHLVTLGALHVMLYHLSVAGEWANVRPHFICEVVAPRKTLVRELSSLNFQENSLLSQQAVVAYLEEIVASPEWREATSEPSPFSACKAILEDRVRWPKHPDDFAGCSEPDALIAELRRAAVGRHRKYVANVHRSYGREIGLVSKRGTNRLRYAPTDPLLKALVLANVENRMEYKEFLHKLFRRYGFVFGEREAEAALPKEDLEKRAFQANSRRLEQRLSSLGMLRRLSDACAYVTNPLARERR